MMFNLYTGSLSRYYAHGSSSETQPNPDIVTDVQQIQKIIVTWQKGLATALIAESASPIKWQERADSPFLTAPMSWHSYGALVLWALYQEQNLAITRDFDAAWQENPAYQIALTEDYVSHYSALTSECEMWLPIAVDFVFIYPNPNHDELPMSSLQRLANDLDVLNKKTWNADKATIESWKSYQNAAETPLFEPNAQYCFSVLSESVAFALHHQLPLLLDY